MKLSLLVKGLGNIEVAEDVSVFGLSHDSRLVKPGDAFFAYKGTWNDGRLYIEDALNKGAAAVIADEQEMVHLLMSKEDFEALAEGYGKPLVWIPRLGQRLGDLAEQFYGNPSEQINMTGVTGTNGKTTATLLIAGAWRALGEASGVIGTLGAGPYNGELQSLNNTTPDSILLSKILASFVTRSIDHVAMEVSSHSLVQGRVNGLKFQTAVFTNLTHDHLDYHKTFEAYGDAKRRLFTWPGLEHAIVNVDDPFGQALLNDLYAAKVVVGYSTKAEIGELGKKLDHVITVRSANLSLKGIYAEIDTSWGRAVLRSPLIGEFNLSNCLAAVAVLCVQGVTLEAAVRAVGGVQEVNGRMQCFGGGKEPLVVVDYAHTPDALEQVLKALRASCKGKLWCVFGCGGDRDKEKRPKMGAIAEQYADTVILTNDNPRYEDPLVIIQDILAGMSQPQQALVSLDREEAIREAVTAASLQDVVLVAGKGHEQTQQMKVHGQLKSTRFCDVQTAKKALIVRQTSNHLRYAAHG